LLWTPGEEAGLFPVFIPMAKVFFRRRLEETLGENEAGVSGAPSCFITINANPQGAPCQIFLLFGSAGQPCTPAQLAAALASQLTCGGGCPCPSLLGTGDGRLTIY
jgi:hypothetical protein